MASYELAQLNIGVIKGPMDSPLMADFAGKLRAPAPGSFGAECPAT